MASKTKRNLAKTIVGTVLPSLIASSVIHPGCWICPVCERNIRLGAGMVPPDGHVSYARRMYTHLLARHSSNEMNRWICTQLLTGEYKIVSADSSSYAFSWGHMDEDSISFSFIRALLSDDPNYHYVV